MKLIIYIGVVLIIVIINTVGSQEIAEGIFCIMEFEENNCLFLTF
jgi:hypothetical protein